MNDLPYRPAAGIMLINADDKVWVGQRIDNVAEAWQMPQGGLDPGEDPTAGAFRELEEETGITARQVQILARSSRDFYYDLPVELVGKLWKGRFRGQRQVWFLMRFIGRDENIVLETEHPEFRQWRWAEPSQLPELIVPFKRQLYKDVLEEFAPFISAR